MSAPANTLPAPEFLFHRTLPAPIWKLWPVADGLVLELRDQPARRVTFGLLDGRTGAPHATFHDPTAPWWLTLVGADAADLWLDELHPDRLGQPGARRVVAWATGTLQARGPAADLPAPPAPDLGVPAVYRAGEAAHFADLARFVARQTGRVPASRVEYLATGAWLLLAFDQPGPVGIASQELLICAAADGRVALRQSLGAAAPGPEAGLFCIFGPFLYVLGGAGDVFAWHLG